ncbi:MAG: choice-of-anchor V domain-containing protein [Myxococcaceae bacterium]|nr:choice-of-anchor V domain-containing protein [Myxococcaceae bacterium]
MRLLCVLGLVVAAPVLANQLGVVGYAGTSASTCNGCHSGGAAPMVTVTGPTTLSAGQVGDYRLTISGGAAVRAGLNVAVDVPEAELLGVTGDTVAFSGELHQATPKAFSAGRASFAFRLKAPPFSGALRLFGAGNSCNGNGGTSGDRAALTTLTVNVTGGSTAPRIATPPRATPATVTTAATRVEVLGADDQPEAGLRYDWSVTRGGAVTFSPNGSNAAKQTVATFSAAGAHQLRVVITDASGQAASAVVDVPVNATATTIAVTPATADVEPGGSVVFSARFADQFGRAMDLPTPMAWSTTGGGTVSSGGRFVAGPRLGGPHVVQAVALGRSGAATVRIVEPGSIDRTPPALSIVSPTPGQLVAGEVAVEVQAVDATRVELLVNGALVDTRLEPPWRLRFDASGQPPGPTQLEVHAFDAAGNRAVATVEARIDVAEASAAGPGCSAGAGALDAWVLTLVAFAAGRRRFYCR